MTELFFISILLIFLIIFRHPFSELNDFYRKLINFRKSHQFDSKRKHNNRKLP